MEGKKVKTLLVLTAIAFLFVAVVIVLAAGIYFSAIALSSSSGAAVSPAALSAASPVIMSSLWDDPLFIWMFAAAAVIIAVFLIILIIILAVRAKKKKKKQAVTEDEIEPDYSVQATVTFETDEEPVITAGIAPLDLGDDVQSASDAADMFIAAESKTESAAQAATKNDELLAKYIRDVNEAADKYRDINSKLAAYVQKRNKLKEKAADIQKRLFKSNSLEIINRYSMTLNKIYKLISKYDNELAAGRKKKADVFDELKELRRAANSYISVYKIPQNSVTAIEDEIIFDIALSKRLVEESGYFNAPLDGSIGDKINDKKKEIAELEAECVYWEQSITEAADEDAKLSGTIKLLELEEKTDTARDELVSLMTEVTDEPQYKSVDEITAAVKKEIKSGSGVVTRDQQKIKARKSAW